MTVSAISSGLPNGTARRFVGDALPAERADIFDRPDEAEIDAALLQIADDCIGRATADVNLNVRESLAELA